MGEAMMDLRVVDLSGAEIRGDREGRNPPIFLPRQPAASPLLALDIGGTLIKLVYTASCGGDGDGAELRFAKFERRRLQECFDFVRAKGLLGCNGTRSSEESVTLKATGGGAYKFAADFREKLGACLDKLDEMDSVVSGANFLLQNIPGAAFTHMNGQRNPVDVSPDNLFPYLLVNIGSGVSVLKVTGNRKFERVTGTHIGGGTMFGLAKLLTGCKSYDEFLQLSQKGDNFVLDLIVKDICGELVCQKIAFLVASLLGLRRVFFGGSYIRGHKSTLENISYAIDFWSQSQMQAVFLRHEGYLGALGALVSYGDLTGENLTLEESKEKEPDHESAAPVDGIPADEENDSNIFPYLLVNIGSGVSMIEVIGKGKFERIIGSHLGGGTILGLARLLTGCSSYEEFLELSQRGNNLSVDLTVGDIYGEEGYPKIGLPASTTAASFGKVNSSKLSDYKIEDLAAALLNSFTYNIGQIAYFVANLSGLKRIFFRGAYVCGHEKTMDKISRSLKYWSKGEVQTTFLCHEGFLGTLGAFWSYENMGIDGLASHEVIREVLLGAPYTGQFPSLPVTEQQENGENNTLEAEVESLRHDNAALKAEVERLQRENVELRAKLGAEAGSCNLVKQ
ncbi:Pantothenate kinase 1 [Dichanthelium oligosanthes]|uniref:Pantothenate kinase 1 n=1 Tax=Dichanthelium oligosanthes TaxID=888268 RepID=A0A1E5WII3_9POAL|nr:Pantothenate kinase 1 [Dichanthelium oligosanthes]